MSRYSGAAALTAAAALALPLLAAAPADAAAPRARAPHTAVVGFGTDQGWRTDHHIRLLTDLTGDGRADIVGFADDGVYTGIGRADGTFTGQTASGVYNFGYLQGWRIGVHPRWVDDVTGDGRPDVVGIGDAGVYTAVGRGDGSFEPIRFVLAAFGAAGRTTTAKFFLTDTDGDHRADIVAVGDGRGVQIALGQPDGGFGQPSTASTAYDFVRYDYTSFQVTDVTGDGRAEILALQLGGSAQVVSSVLGPDGSYTAPRPAGARFFVPEAVLLNRIADVTGDGRPDLVEMDTLNQPEPGTYVARSLGDGTFTNFALADQAFDPGHGWNAARNPRLLADFTGDGRADIAGFGDIGVSTAFARADGTFVTPFPGPALRDFGFNTGWQTALHPRLLADVTGDGRADIVGFGDAGVYTALATGDGSFVQPPDPPVIVTVPDVGGRTQTDAEDRLRAAGLAVTSSSQDTLECAEIGTVVSQSPAGGARVEQGTTVRIGIGVLPPKHSCN